jgi:endoglucanase
MQRVRIPLILAFLATSLAAYTAAEYKEAAWLTLRFFGIQRCGNTGNWALAGHDQTKGGEVCHTRDGEVEGVALSGGWHDCGDHWKVCFTQGFAAFTLLKAYEVFPGGFQDIYKQRYLYTETMPAPDGDGIPDVINEVKVATDYFIKAIPNENTFYAECGNPDYDHQEWKTSAFQTLNPVAKGGDPRPVVKLTAKGGASCAQFVAALALMARLCPKWGMQSYADSCKAAAVRGYAYAKKNASNPHSNGGFYQESQEASDDLIVASTELFFLTKDSTYRNDAFTYIIRKGESGWAYSWNSLWEAAYYNLLKIDSAVTNQNYKTVLTLFKGSLTTGIAKKNGAGLAFYESWGSCRYAGGLAFAMMLLYDIAKTADPQASSQALALATSQVDYIMGSNEFKRPFIHGLANSWDKVHHRNAQGIDNNPPDDVKESTPFKFKRSGALIGGPKGQGVFNNVVVEFGCTESGCDYNAGITGALAGIISIKDPYPSVGVKRAAGPVHATLTLRQAGDAVRIAGSLAQAGPVALTLYSADGRTVRKLDQVRQAGTFAFTWQTDGCGAGIYFCKLTTGSGTIVRTVVVRR